MTVVNTRRAGQVVHARFTPDFAAWETKAIAPGAVDPQALQDLLSAWHDARMGRKMLLASAFEPADFRAPFGAYSALVDLSDGVDEACYGFVGPQLCQLYGRDVRNQPIGACYSGDVLTHVREAYREVVSHRQPVYATRQFRVAGKRFGYHRLILPLSHCGRQVTHAILGISPGQCEPGAEWQWGVQDARLSYPSSLAPLRMGA